MKNFKQMVRNNLQKLTGVKMSLNFKKKPQSLIQDMPHYWKVITKTIIFFVSAGFV